MGQAVLTQSCIGSDNRHGLGKTSLGKDLPFGTISSERKQ